MRNFYVDYADVISEDCIGFEVEPGWAGIIEEMLEKLRPTGIKVVQLKEKFGGLRCYTDTHTDEAHGIILRAEAAASKTCSICGQPGKRQGKHWIRVACEQHADKD